ncbi:MAG TPA: AraC family transcriptional regulator [Rhodanobacteraceae bacterium]
MVVTTDRQEWQEAFLGELKSMATLVAVFDRVPDMVFSIKDRSGCYVLMSESCVERCGLASKQQAIGLTAFDLFPQPMAQRYARQDEQLFLSGRPVIDNLDLTLYPNRSAGWCLTTKQPLHDAKGDVVGLACLSKDVHDPGRASFIDADFADTIDYIHAHLAETLRVEALACMSHLSLAQFERRMRRVFQLSAGQYLLKVRIDAAAQWLRQGALSVAQVALQTGFCDQSALSRKFRQTTGLSPSQYRQLFRERD